MDAQQERGTFIQSNNRRRPKVQIRSFILGIGVTVAVFGAGFWTGVQFSGHFTGCDHAVKPEPRSSRIERQHAPTFAVYEPQPYSDIHLDFFRESINAIETRINTTQIHERVLDDVNMQYCGRGRVPTGSFDVGLESIPTAPTRLRKTYIKVDIRPEHLQRPGHRINANQQASTWFYKNTIRRSDDQKGQLIAAALGGYGRFCNIIPQSGNINAGIWGQKESIARGFLLNGLQRINNSLVVNASGNYVPLDGRFVTLKIALDYCTVGKELGGVLCMEERPYVMHYSFVLHASKTDPDPRVVAGHLLNRSYLREFYFADGAGEAIWKDAPDYYNVQVPRSWLN